MVAVAPISFRSPTENPQPGPREDAKPSPKAAPKTSRPGTGKKISRAGTVRSATRGNGKPVQLECGVTVYPPHGGERRWRAVWYENGARRQCQSVSEDSLTEKLEKVTARLKNGARHMERSGAALIAWYLDPDRLPAADQWSRKHRHTQERLCARFVMPVIAEVRCEDIEVRHMQEIVNAASTPGEGARVAGLLSALCTAGRKAGYLTHPYLAEVHWQARGRDLPAPKAATAGETRLWVDPSEIPSADDVAVHGKALSAGTHGWRDELMMNTAAYSGLRSRRHPRSGGAARWLWSVCPDAHLGFSRCLREPTLTRDPQPPAVARARAVVAYSPVSRSRYRRPSR